MNVIIAIDPGKSGGVAVAAFGKTVCHSMPGTEGDQLELIRDFKRMADVECLPHGPRVDCLCVLEEVNGFVGKAQPGSAMFKFGEGYGFLKGVVQALGIKLVRVRPQVWQKVFGLGTASSCANSREWKNKLKAEAQRRFPDLNVTLATADALLILEWARGAKAESGNRESGNPEPQSASRTGNRATGTEISTPHPGPLPDRGGEGDGGRSARRPTKTISDVSGESPDTTGGPVAAPPANVPPIK